MRADLDHHELAMALEALHLGVSASDLHGSLSGCLCAGADAGIDGWLDVLQLGFDDPAVVRNEVLQRLYRSCRSQVDGSPHCIRPLLPGRAAPLLRRAAALLEWCRGFLGGFGLGGAARSAPLSVEAMGILRDLGMIAASHFDMGDPAEDEQALAEVIDFVCAGCAALHRESIADGGPPTLH